MQEIVGRFFLFGRGQQGRHGLAARQAHFQRALDPLAVSRRQALCRDRVQRLQQGVHGGPTPAGGIAVDLRTQCCVSLWQFCQAMQQGAKIQHGAADQYWYAARCRDFSHCCQRIGTKAGG